ncbi:MAG: ATP-binding protein [Actinobacteria bacterium]|nr:ATP-binding protein [Actinomycetota bacterium]
MAGDFFLGGVIDPKTGDRTDAIQEYDPGDLTTHGVIVGMTGSGKTGLGIIYLEEALRAGIPTLILDPKGDMTNLLLTFPDLAPADFQPWIDPGEAKSEGKTAAVLAEEKASLWKNGLAGWDLDGTTIADLRSTADFTIYTPGSTAGVPLNIVGSLDAPAIDWEKDAEAARDEIEGWVSGLLGLIGIDADPISSREHILLANLIERSWRAGNSLDLATLLGQIQRPPIRKLGVFEIDDFFPPKDRKALAMAINGLVASPSFSSWISGEPLDIQSMLWKDDKPQAAIVYLAHLSDDERQFVVTLLLSKMITWMRTQAGTGDLRALVYMDEVYGFVPPTAEPPAKKPILTLLKQARAFGVGVLLSTQNPVDLDYKAMSNAGTWCVGRLQTERDKARILEALQSASGLTDVGELDATISGLDKRQFLLHNTREKEPSIFTTRWALSYLRGPLTKEQIGDLTSYVPSATSTSGPRDDLADEQTSDASAPELADGTTPVMPTVADSISVYHVDPAAPWVEELGNPDSATYTAGIAARVTVTFDDTPAKLVYTEEYERIFTDLGDRFDPETGVDVDYDDRDFETDPPDGATYRIPEADLNKATWFRSAQTKLKDALYRSQTITIFKNAKLKLYSRPGESREDFLKRCDIEAQNRADKAVAAMRDKYDTRFRRAKDVFATAERRVSELEVDVEGSRRLANAYAAESVVGMLFGRKSARRLTTSMRKRQATLSKEQRLLSAQDKAEDKWKVMQELEERLGKEVAAANDTWEKVALTVEEIEIGLEKTDISVDEFVLVWIPT